MSTKVNKTIQKNSIFKVGNVTSIEGRTVRIKVDKEKNLSSLLYKGDILKNVTVGGYVKIHKGYITIIAKVESESVDEENWKFEKYGRERSRISRILVVKLLGFFQDERFERGIKELPLIDNEAFLLDRSEFDLVHNFVEPSDSPLHMGTLALERGQSISIGVNNLFASHIGIFGNTGSGKSYTLAKLYRSLLVKFKDQSAFKENSKFVLFDFNGEYNSVDCIVSDKKVYNLSTRTEEGEDKLPFTEEDLLQEELFSILANATEKTQKPFIRRALKFYKSVDSKGEPLQYILSILRKRVTEVLKLTDKIRAHLLIDYFRQILPPKFVDDEEVYLDDDIEWLNKSNQFVPKSSEGFFQSNPEAIKETIIYQQVAEFEFEDDFISRVITFLYIQLISDVLANRAQNEHIAPAINKLKSFHKDLKRVVDTENTNDVSIWDESNFVVVNLDKVNINVRKIIPLILSHKLYIDHKNVRGADPNKSLNIIVDEAHNILSYSSERESETWKDYRLETFEEIIKEGRKFGVFLTIASQRPHDISTTIISQLHNYFLHRLINNNDISAIERTVSYLDKVSFDTLPVLPTGTCIIAGIFTPIPVIVKIDAIAASHEPNNKTIDMVRIWLD